MIIVGYVKLKINLEVLAVHSSNSLTRKLLKSCVSGQTSEPSCFLPSILQKKGKVNLKWKVVQEKDMHSFIALLITMGLVKLPRMHSTAEMTGW